MSSPLLDTILSRIREHGPLTVAEYMALALYHPAHGYYAAAPRRSGRGGDFFTSVDVGPLFGELIAAQLAECWGVLRRLGAARFHLVEAGASDGRLARDILDATAREFPELHDALHVTLVERSACAVEAQMGNLAEYAARVTFGRDRMPQRVTGAILANELLDALPAHRLVVRNGSLREVHITEADGALISVELRPSTQRLEDFVEWLEIAPPEGIFIEAGLAACEWIAAAAGALEQGFLLLFDYGADARTLYSQLHACGTLAAYRRHAVETEDWLATPGQVDLTAHVNLTAVRRSAEAAGLRLLGAVDQTYFLTSLGLAARLDGGASVTSVRRRLAARTLIMPGGLGSTVKAMVFGKAVGTPSLQGFASGRLTR